MTPAALDPPARRVLRALFELAQLDCPAHAGVLARAVDMRAVDVARVLLVLEARGLARAGQARLTLTGLALAARCEPLQLEAAPSLARAQVPGPVATRLVRSQRGRAAGAHNTSVGSSRTRFGRA